MMTNILFLSLSCFYIFSSDLTMAYADSIEALKAGVVKITAKDETSGTTRVGTGIVVRVEDDAVSIVTAGHVIAGDLHPLVTFYGKPEQPFSSRVLRSKKNAKVDLAALLVQGKVPEGIRSLKLEQFAKVVSGERVRIMGFPRVSGVPWAMTSGEISGYRGQEIAMTGVVSEGNSGSPLFYKNRVFGLITRVGPEFSYAISSNNLIPILLKWGIAVLPPSRMTGKDGIPMVLVPAGEFSMGSPEKGGNQEEHPQHLVYLDAYYIDTFEVAMGKYDKFLRDAGHEPPDYWKAVDLATHRDRPVFKINWVDAKAYCEWADKRLPTEAEWEKAARGRDGRIYPWGNSLPDSDTVSFGKGRPHQHFSDRLQPVGSHKAGQSFYEALHMAGNVSEWVSDWYREDYYSTSPQQNPIGPAQGKYKVLRGGSWDQDIWFFRSASRDWSSPTYRSHYHGVRCAQDAQ